MFRLPEDLMSEISIKYPDANIRQIVQDIFSMIIEKTLKDGACRVTELGKFESFKTNSKKLGTEVIRLKFRLSPVLEKKIKFDPYLLSNAPIKAKIPFTEKNLEKCNETVKKANIDASVKASRLGDLRTKEKSMEQLVKNILNS